MRFWMLTLFASASISAFSQKEFDDRGSWRDRIYTGGGLGFSGGTDGFGNRYFNFSVSPIVGYMISSQFSAGTGVSYQRINYPDIKFSYSQYAFMPFLRYNFDNLFLTTEYNYINLPRVVYNNNGYSESTRIFRSRWLAGVGYSKPLGGRSRVNVVAMYDLLYRRPSVFYSPWVFRVFVSF
jgi:hypothetical protein